MKEIYFLYTLYTYFSAQSPFTATHFFNRSIHLFIPSMKKVCGWLLIHLRTSAATSASDEKCLPFTVSFNFGNNQKSDGAKSGLWNHCEFQACHGILSLCTAIWPCVVMQKKRVFFRPDSVDALLE